MTRIRYTKVGDTLVSKPMIAGTESLSVLIDITDMKMVINNNTTNKVVEAISADTLAKLKSYAKASLKSLGVIFSDEVRRRERELPF